MALNQDNVLFPIALSASGLLEAELTWPEPGALLGIYLNNPSGLTPLAQSQSSTGSPQRFSYDATPGNYRVGVFQRAPQNQATPPLSTSGATYTLRVTHP
jgi:hypothetical protein